MVVEEPDIEIGQGVSSKAISRRNEKATKNHRQRDRDDENPNPKWRAGRDDRRGGNRRSDEFDKRNDRFGDVSGPPPMPAVPSFGAAGFPTLPNGMPMFPFMFPGAGQPPPPGR